MVRDVIPCWITTVEICLHIADCHDGVLLGGSSAPERVASGPMHEAYSARCARGAGGEGEEVFAVGVKVDFARGPVKAVFVVGLGRVKGDDVDVEIGFSGTVMDY